MVHPLIALMELDNFKILMYGTIYKGFPYSTQPMYVLRFDSKEMMTDCSYHVQILETSYFHQNEGLFQNLTLESNIKERGYSLKELIVRNYAQCIHSMENLDFV